MVPATIGTLLYRCITDIIQCLIFIRPSQLYIAARRGTISSLYSIAEINPAQLYIGMILNCVPLVPNGSLML